jgi:hypothetical protein
MKATGWRVMHKSWNDQKQGDLGSIYHRYNWNILCNAWRHASKKSDYSRDPANKYRHWLLYRYRCVYKNPA